MKKNELRFLPTNKIITLKRNPQYLTPKQMEGLKKSILRDGFCAPILVRPIKNGKFETISGNHRFMAACEIGLKHIPCVISKISDKSAKRLAINLNTIHGEPTVELLAPFLSEIEINDLTEIHIEDGMKKELLSFDTNLTGMFKKMELDGNLNRDSPNHKNQMCQCPLCGRKHFKNEM